MYIRGTASVCADMQICKYANMQLYNRATNKQIYNMSSGQEAGVTQDTSYHTGEETGNLGMAWYKENFSEELKKMGSKIKKTVEHGYRLPVQTPEDNAALRGDMDKMSLEK